MIEICFPDHFQFFIFNFSCRWQAVLIITESRVCYLQLSFILIGKNNEAGFRSVEEQKATKWRRLFDKISC